MSISQPRMRAIAEISDAALMERLAGGNVDALGLLHQRYARMIRSLMLRLTPALTMEQAADLSQEVFLTLLETAPRYREQGQFRSWLCGIAVRKSRSWQRRNWFRRRRLNESGLAVVGHAAGRDGDESDRLEAQQRVVMALSSLSASQREVVVLSVIEELSADMIAKTLGIKTSTVWVRLHRARKAMRDAVNKADLERGKHEL